MDENKQRKTTCRICGNCEYNAQYIAREMMYGFRDEFAYFQCKHCKCLQIEEFPKDINKYYPENYYSFGKYDGKKFNGLAGFLNRKRYSFLLTGSKFLRSSMKWISGNNYRIFDRLDLSKKTKILDVGCGSGKKFLYPLAEIGFKNAHGCDPFLKESLVYENGLEIDDTSIFELKGAWDIITFHHSFEHIPDPLSQLKKVHELLKPGGVCIVRIPTVSSFAWEHYGENWVQLDAPRHFFLHSKKSMQILGEQSDLELCQVDYDSTHFQFSGSEKYVNNIPLRSQQNGGLLKLLQEKSKQRKYQKEAELLNQQNKGDQAAFFFRRKKQIH